jgi:formate dehydrogenase maturation protein FdhE
MKCPHCKNTLVVKMETLTLDETNEDLNALVCNECKTYIGIYHYNLVDKIDSLGELVLNINQ